MVFAHEDKIVPLTSSTSNVILVNQTCQDIALDRMQSSLLNYDHHKVSQQSCRINDSTILILITSYVAVDV
jgi:hypothetical protein